MARGIWKPCCVPEASAAPYLRQETRDKRQEAIGLSSPVSGVRSPVSGLRSSVSNSNKEHADMCGIVGYVGPREATEVVVGGLGRLEYRGYDSAGIAIDNGKTLQLRRSVGKLANLVAQLREQ